MRLAKVIGTVTATAKPHSLSGRKLLLVDVVDHEDIVIEKSLVAVDTIGAGVGDICIMSEGSAARMAEYASGLPIDASLIAIVDHCDVN